MTTDSEAWAEYDLAIQAAAVAVASLDQTALEDAYIGLQGVVDNGGPWTPTLNVWKIRCRDALHKIDPERCRALVLGDLMRLRRVLAQMRDERERGGG